MIWSKKMKLFDEMMADSLRSHLSLRTAGYRDAFLGRGRTWFEYDGAEIVSVCDFRTENAWRSEGQDYAAVARMRIFSKDDFGRALGRFFQMNIDDALRSEEPLLIALAVLDRRVGKRRLSALSLEPLGEPADTLLRYRLLAEKMMVPNNGPSVQVTRDVKQSEKNHMAGPLAPQP